MGTRRSRPSSASGCGPRRERRSRARQYLDLRLAAVQDVVGRARRSTEWRRGRTSICHGRPLCNPCHVSDQQSWAMVDITQHEKVESGSGEPARTRRSWRRRRARHEPEQSREADESRGPDRSGRGNVENECRVRLRSPARRASAPAPPRATRSRGLAARAGPAAARPRCALPRAAGGRRSADTQRRRWRTPGAAAPPTAKHSHAAIPTPPGALRLSLGAPRNHRRPPGRVRREHPVKAQRVKTRGRNQQRQLLERDRLRATWRCPRAADSRLFPMHNDAGGRPSVVPSRAGSLDAPERSALRGLVREPSAAHELDRFVSSRHGRCATLRSLAHHADLSSAPRLSRHHRTSPPAALGPAKAMNSSQLTGGW
jgi:hypothetical protein